MSEWPVEFYPLTSLPPTSCCCCPSGVEGPTRGSTVVIGSQQFFWSCDYQSRGRERERERRLTEQTVKLGPEKNDQLLPPLCFVGAKDPQMGYLLALPTKALKDIIVFRLIIEYSSLRDFYRPLGNNNRSSFFLMSIFEQ